MDYIWAKSYFKQWVFRFFNAGMILYSNEQQQLSLQIRDLTLVLIGESRE